MCVITILCWGSWANTQKLATKEWRFQLFYWVWVAITPSGRNGVRTKVPGCRVTIFSLLDNPVRLEEGLEQAAVIELDQELPKPLRVFSSEILLRWILWVAKTPSQPNRSWSSKHGGVAAKQIPT